MEEEDENASEDEYLSEDEMQSPALPACPRYCCLAAATTYQCQIFSKAILSTINREVKGPMQMLRLLIFLELTMGMLY